MDTEREDVLPLRELEALAGALLTVLLSLMCASIARKQAEPLQFPAELRIKFNQCAGNAEAGGAGLSADPAAIGEDQDIEAVSQLGSEQRLAHVSAGRFVCKIVFKRPVVDRDLTFTGPQEDTRGGSLAASGSQLLN
jgi:hypothetical protein